MTKTEEMPDVKPARKAGEGGSKKKDPVDYDALERQVRV